MKKILLVLSILLATTSLTYATNGNIKVKSENELNGGIDPSVDSNLSNTGTGLGKGDSFLAAFGMETSQGTTGTTGGTSSAGSTTVALTITSSEATSLTSIQNTPYSYK